MTKKQQKDKVPKGHKRSSKWPGVRRAFLKSNPKCEVCSSTKKLEVHHIHPFHLQPCLELDDRNLITLCENDKDGVNCHLLFGHLGNFKSFNTDVRDDAAKWRIKIASRPTLSGKYS